MLMLAVPLITNIYMEQKTIVDQGILDQPCVCDVPCVHVIGRRKYLGALMVHVGVGKRPAPGFTSLQLPLSTTLSDSFPRSHTHRIGSAVSQTICGPSTLSSKPAAATPPRPCTSLSGLSISRCLALTSPAHRSSHLETSSILYNLVFSLGIVIGN